MESSGVVSLVVFQRAYKLSLEVHKATLCFPKMEQYALGDQMRRASKSICATLSEGYGKKALSAKEFRRFVFMAIGSADEMRIWCRYALDLNYITPAQWESWRNEYQQIAKMLQAFAKSSPDP